MGIACWTICVDCDEDAPEMGDCGYMGYPSLDDKVPDIDVATFGSIYKGLAAVHVITDDVDEFRRFLERHRGHRVVTETEDGSPFDDEEDMDYEDEDWDEDYAEDESDSEDDEEESLEVEDYEGDEDDDGSADRYVTARYQASCPQCDRTFLTKHSYGFVPFERTTLTAQAVQMYQRRVVSVIDDASYHAEPLYDGDLEDLARFFEDHVQHEVVVELVPQKD